jgi:HNH endonuclease
MKVDTLFDNAEPSGDCWLWTRAKNSKGYGIVRTYGRIRRAHRVAHELRNGPVPDGLFVCHSCDTPGCINPDHLWTGTHKENVADRVRKAAKQ